MKKLVAILTAIGNGMLGSVLITIVCVIVWFILGGIMMWLEHHREAGGMLLFANPFIGVIGKILSLATIPGMIVLSFGTFVAPASGAGMFAKKALSKAYDNLVFDDMPRYLSGFCGIVSFVLVLAVTGSAWEFARAAGVLPPDMNWPGSFYSHWFVITLLVIGVPMAAWAGYSED